MTAITEGGTIAVIVAVVLGLFEFLKRIWPNKQSFACPNKIEGLYLTMKNIDKLLTKIEDDTSHTRVGNDQLVSQHAPNGGVEQWKLPKQVVPLLEQSIGQGKEAIGQNTEIIRLLEKIADRRSESR